MRFTSEQAKIVEHITGNVVVIAGAGSGKTRCLIERTARLVESGCDQDGILTFTFTKKAATEITGRMLKRLNCLADDLDVHTSTIHSLALQIFRENLEFFGYEGAVTIWSPDRREKLLKGFLKEILTHRRDPFGVELREEEITPAKLKEAEQIRLSETQKQVLKSLFKDTLKIMMVCPPIPYKISGVPPRRYYKSLLERDFGKIESTAAALFLLAKEGCQTIEFDDMIPAAVRVLKELEDCSWKFKFQHIMVDEYQDMNDINVEFVSCLMGEQTESLMCVGDDDQAIYGFRGGNNQHILNFTKRFGGEKLFLTKNFRSVPEIIEVANFVVQNNLDRYDKAMVPHRETKERCSAVNIEWIAERSPVWEIVEQDPRRRFARFPREKQYLRIYSLIEGLLKDGRKTSDFAILARTNSALSMAGASFKLLNDLQKNYDDRIKFDLLGVSNLFERKIIKEVIAWCNIFLNPKDWVSLREGIMNALTGFGPKSGDYLLETVLEFPDESIPNLLRKMDKYPRHGKKTKKYQAITAFADNLEVAFKVLEESGTNPIEIWELAEVVSGTHHRLSEEGLRAVSSESEAKVDLGRESLREARAFVKNYAKNSEGERKGKTWQDVGTMLLDTIAVEAEIDAEIQGVQIMTMHSAKGKEWPVVFLMDVFEEIMPSPRSDDLEEERRLYYVGMTRAEDLLYICGHTARSLFWSETEEAQNKMYAKLGDPPLDRMKEAIYSKLETEGEVIDLDPPFLQVEGQETGGYPDILTENYIVTFEFEKSYKSKHRRIIRKTFSRYAAEENKAFLIVCGDRLKPTLEVWGEFDEAPAQIMEIA